MPDQKLTINIQDTKPADPLAELAAIGAVADSLKGMAQAVGEAVKTAEVVKLLAPAVGADCRLSVKDGAEAGEVTFRFAAPEEARLFWLASLPLTQAKSVNFRNDISPRAA